MLIETNGNTLMPRMEVRGLKQKAVYWPLDSYANRGIPTAGAAVEIMVRWIHSEAEVIDPTGAPVRIDATAVVDRDITPGSRMWLGAKVDLPDPITDQMEVVTFDKTPDVKGRYYRREVTLRRLRAET